MGTHLIPRQIDGDARILLIFTPKGFIGVLIGIGIGAILFKIAEAAGATIVGWILLGICALIGFIIGQVKIPESNAYSLFRKVGGVHIYEVIKRYFAFRKTRKIYIYEDAKEEQENVSDKKIDKIIKK